MIVLEELPHPADFSFAQRCLEGDARAVAQLQPKYGSAIEAFLRKAGGSETEASDIVGQLWTDCLSERENNRPRLATYSGKASLKSWLSTLALNQLIRHKRKVQRYVGFEEGKELTTGGVVDGEDEAELPLIEILHQAVMAGFLECPPEDFVLLQLAHLDGLHLEELAVMFSCSKSKIDRDVKSAGRRVRKATLAYVRSEDPWLELKWQDFVKMCRFASPTCFGTTE